MTKENSQIQEDIVYHPELPINLFLASSQDIVSDYICPLCQGVYLSPIIDNCGHIFCEKCFSLFYSKYRKCPITKEILDKAPTSVKIISQILDKQMLKCKNKLRGCGWTGHLKELDNHIQKDCMKQMFVCENEGCNEQLLREKKNEHLKVCRFKKEKCPYCEKLFKLNEHEEHFKECPKIEIDCPQKCGQKIVREHMDNHILNNCLYSEVACPYTKYGCQDTKILKKDFDEKMKKDIDKHMLLAVECIEEMKVKYENLEKEVQQLKNPETYLQLLLDSQKGQEKQSLSNLLLNKGPNNKNHQIDLTAKTHLSLVKPEKDISFIKKRNRTDSEEVEEKEMNQMKSKDKIKEKENTKVRDSEYPIITSQVNVDRSISSSSSHSKKDFFDKQNLKKTIVVTGKIARYISTEKPEHTYLFVNKSIDVKNCSDLKTWKIKFLTNSLWLGVGVCDKKKVISNNMKFISPKRDQADFHGSYLISSNGYSWNCNEPEENNKVISLPVIEKGSIIEITYNNRAKELIFSVNTYSVKLTKVKPVFENNTKLTPCVLFLHNGNSVEFTDINF